MGTMVQANTSRIIALCQSVGRTTGDSETFMACLWWARFTYSQNYGRITRQAPPPCPALSPCFAAIASAAIAATAAVAVAAAVATALAASQPQMCVAGDTCDEAYRARHLRHLPTHKVRASEGGEPHRC